MSLSDASVSVMLPITDPDRAREFYGERLGLRDDGTDEEGSLLFRAGGSEIVLRKLPPGSQSEHTALSFEVADIATEISELEARGVRFEDYDTPDFKTVDHIFSGQHERAAWFMDPDGNILCLHEVMG